MARNKKKPSPGSSKWEKKPVISGPGVFDTNRFQWTTQYAVCEGSWGWHHIDIAVLLKAVLPKLNELETMTWEQVCRAGSHPVDKQPLPQEAARYVAEHHADFVGEAPFSLRLRGAWRVVGYRTGNVLVVLWWDPEHRMFPWGGRK
jgi:hypothetical protein